MVCPFVIIKNRDKEVITECIKYNLTIEEAVAYFNIGETKLRNFCKEHWNENFLIRTGNKILIKRKLFEKYLDEEVTCL
jgi:Excisionase from transposon Tn916.